MNRQLRAIATFAIFRPRRRPVPTSRFHGPTSAPDSTHIQSTHLTVGAILSLLIAIPENVADPGLNVFLGHVLRDELFYDFLAAALMTVGLVSTVLATIRRDILLAYFGIFTFLYGFRLGLERTLIEELFGYSRLYVPSRGLMTFLVPIPFLLFFSKAEMIGRLGRISAVWIVSVSFLLFALTPFTGHPHWMTVVNNTSTLVGITLFVVSLRQHRKGGDLRFAAWGFGIFLVSVVYDNVFGLIHEDIVHVEPLGMCIFLGALGYVAVGRALRREQKLISLESELELARRIQQSILPTSTPNSSVFQVAARYVPMTDVAGDFYDYVLDHERQLAVLIADVSGHGIPAALIASMVKLAAASHRTDAHSPGVALGRMNKSLFGNTQTQFVTAGLVYLDAELRLLRYSGAAHPPMLRLRGDEVSEIEENGLMLAAFDFADYQSIETSLIPGDRYLMYTDGVVEAADAGDEFFGLPRLKAEFLNSRDLSLSAAIDKLLNSVLRWHTKQNDDLTLILLEYPRL